MHREEQRGGGGGLSVTLQAHDKSLYLKPIHESGKWTIGGVMENRAGGE